MKNDKYVILLFISLTLCVFISLSSRIITESTREAEVLVEVIYEPVIIEREVIVYKEAEPVIETIEEPIPVIQSIDESFDIMIPSGLTVNELADALGPAREGLVSSVDAIIDAEELYDINALYLTSMLGFESGWGSYENGINNIAGWKGDRGNFSNFDSRYECIMTVAEGLSTNFKNDVGSNIQNVALRYCPDYGYLDTLLQIMNELNN